MAFGDAPSFVKTDLFGGTGAVTVSDLLRGRALPPFMAVLGCELAPNGSVGRHQQQHFPEIIVGLEGDGEATVDEVAYRLGPGDVVFLPHGAVLSLRNRSDCAPLRYLIVKVVMVPSPAP